MMTQLPDSNQKLAKRKSVARFKVEGRFDGATEATVEIDRQTNLISVRPKYRKRAYILTLSDIAETIIWRIVRAEAAEKRKAKKRKRF